MANFFVSVITIFLARAVLATNILGTQDGCIDLDGLGAMFPEPMKPIENPLPLELKLEPILSLLGELSDIEVTGIKAIKPFMAVRIDDDETVPMRLALNATDEELVIRIKYEATGYIQIPSFIEPLLPIHSGDLVGTDYATVTLTNLTIQILSNNATMGPTGIIPARLDNVTHLNVSFGKLDIQFDNLFVGGKPLDWEEISELLTILWNFLWAVIEKPILGVVETFVNQFLEKLAEGGEMYQYLNSLASDPPICLEDTFPGAFTPDPPPTTTPAPTTTSTRDPSDTTQTPATTSKTTTTGTPETTPSAGARTTANAYWFLQFIILAILFRM